VTGPAVVPVVVFDTNALLPLLLGATRRAKALRQLWQARRFELCITPQSLDDVPDNVFLAAALEAGADYLVTQDPHLQNLKYYHGTQIISLAQFAGLFALE
jgi:predicted nucleic acid-binding protein